jgi:uncharacterized protein (TIGR00369 family)
VAPDDDLTGQLHEWMPLCAALGMRATALDAERVVLHLDWRPELCTGGGLMHGGALMALADAAGGACAARNLPAGSAGTSTIESKTNFIRGVTEGTVTVGTAPLHVGRTTIVVESVLHDDAGRLVAKVTQTQAVLWPR